jgi:hypothetical protein
MNSPGSFPLKFNLAYKTAGFRKIERELLVGRIEPALNKWTLAAGDDGIRSLSYSQFQVSVPR